MFTVKNAKTFILGFVCATGVFLLTAATQSSMEDSLKRIANSLEIIAGQRGSWPGLKK